MPYETRIETFLSFVRQTSDAKMRDMALAFLSEHPEHLARLANNFHKKHQAIVSHDLVRLSEFMSLDEIFLDDLQTYPHTKQQKNASKKAKVL